MLDTRIPPCSHCDYNKRGVEMKARLVRIGNSRGVRLPRPLIEEAGLPDDVDLRVDKGTIVIAPARPVRGGWQVAAERAHQTRDDRLLGSEMPTRFEEEDWRW